MGDEEDDQTPESYAGKMPVRTLTIVGTAEQEFEWPLVGCRLRGHSVWLEDCRACEQCVEIRIDPLGRDSYALCVVPEELAPPKPRAPAVVLEANAPVTDIMPSRVIAVQPDVTASELINVLFERGVSGVPVVDEEARPIGVVSMADIIRCRYERHEEDRPTVDQDEVEVRELMNETPVCILEGTPIVTAAALMVSHRVHRLPVVNQEGEVVGVVGTFDILRWMTRQAGYEK